MFQTLVTKDNSGSSQDSNHGIQIFTPAPTIDSETGLQVLCQDEDICPKSTESSIYLMPNFRIGKRDCLTFFDSGANAHLIDIQLARKDEVQLISSKSTALGAIVVCSIMTEYGSFWFNLGPGEDRKYHQITAVCISESVQGCVGALESYLRVQARYSLKLTEINKENQTMQFILLTEESTW